MPKNLAKERFFISKQVADDYHEGCTRDRFRVMLVGLARHPREEELSGTVSARKNGTVTIEGPAMR